MDHKLGDEEYSGRIQAFQSQLQKTTSTTTNGDDGGGLIACCFSRRDDFCKMLKEQEKTHRKRFCLLSK